MKDKLELKDIYMYLPWGLKVQKRLSTKTKENTNFYQTAYYS